MTKSIAVFGAGPGLGQAVARRYANDGYAVALVARQPEPLERLAGDLRTAGGSAYAIAGDLSDTASAAALAEQVREQVGAPDAIYYGPTPGGAVRPTAGAALRPSELAPDDVEAYMPTGFYTLVALVQEFLGHMLKQQDGAVLTAAGASAVRGVPYFSGPGPSLAAQRNYLECLEADLAGTGVFVGRLYIGATIKNSAWHQRIQAMEAAGQPTRSGDTIIDPADLADIVWKMHHTTKQPEVLYPERVFDR
jgi:NADP-dependent 3-hydroxy acid dehydrogenase YdfG